MISNLTVRKLRRLVKRVNSWTQNGNVDDPSRLGSVISPGHALTLRSPYAGIALYNLDLEVAELTRDPRRESIAIDSVSSFRTRSNT